LTTPGVSNVPDSALSRYTRPEMAHIWSPAHRFEVWRRIELLALEASSGLGRVPRAAAEEVARRADFPIGDDFVRRVDEVEREVRHDVIAFVTALAERAGEGGRYLHYGLTSYDIVDTALSVLLGEAAGVILDDLDRLLATLSRLADRHRRTPMIGRTHGVHAQPITFGVKLALWHDEVRRARRRIERARETVRVGKLSGAVGMYGEVEPAVEARVLDRLGLEVAPASSQVLGRDRHAEFVCALAVAAGSLEKFAVEIRILQRTEVGEVEEPFYAGQRGSSAMPHKKNPIVCERVTGLARVVRGAAAAALENIALWHERDISNSAVERLILPQATTIIDYMICALDEVLAGLVVDEARMRQNLDLTGGLIFSGAVLTALVAAGMSRDEAYRLVQGHAMASRAGGPTFRERVTSDAVVLARLGEAGTAACFDLDPYVRYADLILDRAGIPRGDGGPGDGGPGDGHRPSQDRGEARP